MLYFYSAAFWSPVLQFLQSLQLFDNFSCSLLYRLHPASESKWCIFKTIYWINNKAYTHIISDPVRLFKWNVIKCIIIIIIVTFTSAEATFNIFTFT